MINESCHLSSKVEIMVSICLIASCKYKKHAIFLSCFGDFSDSSYFLPGLFRILGWIWGAVFGISAFSATFSCSFLDFGLGLRCCFGDFCGFSYFFLLFSGFLAGFGVLFWGFLRFQLLFSGFFGLGLGCCFGDFCGFSYFFLLFSGFLGGFGVLFWEFLRFQLHKARLLCYQPMAIVHYDN